MSFPSSFLCQSVDLPFHPLYCFCALIFIFPGFFLPLHAFMWFLHPPMPTPKPLLYFCPWRNFVTHLLLLFLSNSVTIMEQLSLEGTSENHTVQPSYWSSETWRHQDDCENSLNAVMLQLQHSAMFPAWDFWAVRTWKNKHTKKISQILK